VAALGKLAGGWPPQNLPTGDPLDEPFDVWHGALDIDPEKVFELAIIADRKLRDALGFSSAVRSQVWISDRSRPDLVDDYEGIVGEVKRVIRAKDVKQVERYLEDLGDPDWRAVMIHHADMSDRVADALDDSKDSARIEVWRLEEQRNGKFKAVLERKPVRRSGRRGR